MIKKYIPEKYDLENIDIFGIVENIIGKVPMRLKGRILEINAILTTTQKLQIRNDFLSVVEEVEDITL